MCARARGIYRLAPRCITRGLHGGAGEFFHVRRYVTDFSGKYSKTMRTSPVRRPADSFANPIFGGGWGTRGIVLSVRIHLVAVWFPGVHHNDSFPPRTGRIVFSCMIFLRALKTNIREIVCARNIPPSTGVAVFIISVKTYDVQ